MLLSWTAERSGAAVAKSIMGVIAITTLESLANIVEETKRKKLAIIERYFRKKKYEMENTDAGSCISLNVYLTARSRSLCTILRYIESHHAFNM